MLIKQPINIKSPPLLFGLTKLSKVLLTSTVESESLGNEVIFFRVRWQDS